MAGQVQPLVQDGASCAVQEGLAVSKDDGALLDAPSGIPVATRCPRVAHRHGAQVARWEACSAPAVNASLDGAQGLVWQRRDATRYAPSAEGCRRGELEHGQHGYPA